MAIPKQWFAEFYPHGNAELKFTVGNSALSVDPSTGNTVEGEYVLEYLASLTLTAPSWQASPGSDTTVYQVRGKLLRPAVFDVAITNGSVADAVINGVHGRLEVNFDAAQNPAFRQDLRQNVLGTFRVTGGSR